MAPRPHYYKLGTIPEFVYFRYNYKPRVGLAMQVRKYNHPYPHPRSWFWVLVTRVNPDGWFLCEPIH